MIKLSELIECIHKGDIIFRIITKLIFCEIWAISLDYFDWDLATVTVVDSIITGCVTPIRTDGNVNNARARINAHARENKFVNCLKGFCKVSDYTNSLKRRC